MSSEEKVSRPTRIAKIFQAVAAQVEANVRDAGGQPPTQKLGGDRLSDALAPPAITWVILGGHVSPARQVGADNVLGIREIAERHVRILVHIWAEDFEKTEELANHFVAACRSPVLTAYSFTAISEDWTEGQSASSGLGRLCKLEIEIRVPFTAEPLGLTTPPNVVTINPSVLPPS